MESGQIITSKKVTSFCCVKKMGPGTTARKRQGSTTDNTCFYDICELIYTNALEYKSKETPSMYLHPKDSK